MADKPDDQAEARRRRIRSYAAPARRSREVRLKEALDILPPEPPFRPLGYLGETYYFVDARLQLRGIAEDKFNRARLIGLCMPALKWLEEHYPRMRDGKPVGGIAVAEAADRIMQACTIMGQWSPDTLVRGRGAWAGTDGDLILHRGDHLVMRGRSVMPGLYGDYLYPAGKPLAPLNAEWQTTEGDGPGAALLARLDRFAWSRGALDSLLMLGWIAAAMLAGALDFRPHVFIVGEFAAGKSTLQAVLRGVFGEGGIISVSDTSAAGLWQAFGPDCLPAGVDELEAVEDRRRQDELVRLIRQATSGGQVLRGGADHHGVQFAVRSAFCCSAIIPPPMASQDASRFHVFNLLSAPIGAASEPINLDGLDLIGRVLLRRLAANYGRLRLEILPAYTARLVERGFPRRAADLYAILLGAADLALHDATDLARLDQWLGHRWMGEIRDGVLREQTAEWERCFGYLASSRLDPRQPAGEAIGELLALVATALRRLPVGQADMLGGAGDGLDEESGAARAHIKLQTMGLRLAWRPPGGDGEPGLWLYVANQHRALAAIYEATPWQTIPGAASGGGWATVLRRMPGAQAAPRPVRFRDGVVSRAVMLPGATLWPLGEDAAADPAPLGEGPADGRRLN